MKKLMSIVLTLILIMGLCTTALAEENTGVTFSGGENRTYNGYQLLDLTIGLKGDGHHTAHDGEHTDTCYNYAYTVIEKYRPILQEETLANGRNELWGDEKPTLATSVTDEQILQYLAYQSSDNGDVTGTMRQVADRIYREILDQNIEPDMEDITDATSIDKGYWLFADVTDMDGDMDANSLVMVDTKGDNAITITPKVSIPTVEKKVKDIEDSEDASIGDNYWHDSADHDMGDDEIPFKLTATLPNNYKAYHQSVTQDDGSIKDVQVYKLVFHDTMSPGLTLNPDTLKVYLYDSKYKADVDTDLNDFADEVPATSYTLKETGLTDGCSFELVFENIFAIPDVTITKDTAFVVYYEAELNENAVIGADGNPNEVYLEFSNNPYGEGTGFTEKDKVTVFTYRLTINKTDSHGHELEGAGFKLYKKNVDSDYELIGEEQKLDAEGKFLTTFVWEGLDDGDYKLEESTVPDGFNKMADITFSISATHSETADDPKLLLLDGGLLGTGDVVEVGSGDEVKTVPAGSITKNVINNAGTILPETGGRGTLLLISASATVAMMAAIFMITRKKMSIYAD